MEKNRELATSIVKNSFYGLAHRLIERGCSFALIIILARVLLPASYGLYSITLSVALIITTIMDWGLTDAVNRYVPFQIGKGDKKKAASYFRHFLKEKIFLAIISAFLLAVLAYPLSMFAFHKPALFFPFLAASLYIAFYAIELFLQQLFYIFRQVKFAAVKEIISQSIKIGLIVLLFFIIRWQNNISLIFISYFIASSLVVLFLFSLCKSRYSFLFDKSSSNFDKKKLKTFRTHISIAMIASILFSYVDIITIGVLIKDSSYVGYYTAAFGLVSSLSGLLAFNNVLSPVFSQARKEQLKRVFLASFRYSLMLTIPISLGVMFLSNYILLIYGRSYLTAAIILSILSLVIFFTTSASIPGALFVSRGKPIYYMKIFLYSSILNSILIVASILFLLKFSMIYAVIGVALSSVFSRAVYLIWLLIKTKKVFNLSIRKNDFIKPLVSGLLMFFGLYLFKLYFIKDMTLIWGIILVLIGAAIYFAIMALIRGFSIRDIKIILSSLPGKNRISSPITS